MVHGSGNLLIQDEAKKPLLHDAKPKQPVPRRRPFPSASFPCFGFLRKTSPKRNPVAASDARVQNVLAHVHTPHGESDSDAVDMMGECAASFLNKGE
jgi:hypothetical protein